ncbi:endonuclease [Pseudomonas gingeri]|uniref:endonuclease n=1 Tax=Pseudomonas gingeri TaxID=117681 RepID=UPI0015A006F3|nr:endonuclease [Pseudomonas gingeri]NWD71309.1 endonuclease [Pseudomonas gingeri]
MRAVIRKTAKLPDAMSGDTSPAAKELQKLQRYFSAPTGSPPAFAVYKSDSVKKQLDELFHGKCAYCESFYASTAPVDVEHYRPKGAVSESSDHPGYWWIAMDWDNLLPSCIDCNRKRKQITPRLSNKLLTLQENRQGFSDSSVVLTGKKDSFPILGPRAMSATADLAAEYPLLLDPCRDNPDDHLRFHIDRANLIGLVLPRPHQGADLPGVVDVDATMLPMIREALEGGLSLKGILSIHVYGLNRLGLVQERTRLLRQLEFLEMFALEMRLMADELEPDPDVPILDAQDQARRSRDERIAKRLRFLQEQILGQMKAMARPDAPYSAMVREWIEGFKARLMA